jgi:2-C-methyl-D-erythritol 4-phosphate cytidylyltransferase
MNKNNTAKLKVGLIVTAAGTSSRFDGGKHLKQFVNINERPMIRLCCEKFEGIDEISETIITALPDRVDQMNKLFTGLDLSYRVIPGGETRKDSVRLAFEQLPKVDVVMIHDGARPYVTESLLRRLLSASRESKAVIPVVPIVDTIKKVVANKVEETLDRNTLFCVQTPQVFHYNVLKKAYEEFGDEAVTDESSLVEKLGISVRTVQGEMSNIKVTFSSDIK